MKIIETMTHDGHCNETFACDCCAQQAQGQPGVQIYEPDVDSYDADDTCTICGIGSERLEQRQAIHNAEQVVMED